MLKIEIGGYLSQQVFEPSLIAKYSSNPRLFWEDNAVIYPMLQQLAALFLGMSARPTCMPVECLFSVTSMICNNRRSSICPLKLNKISFLHDNLDHIMSVCDEQGHELVTKRALGLCSESVIGLPVKPFFTIYRLCTHYQRNEN